MENIKLSSFAELSTEEMYTVDGGLIPLFTLPLVPVVWWLIRRK